MKTNRLAAGVAAIIFCAALLYGAAHAQSAAPTPGSNDDMKMMALDGLRRADPSVAVPQIEKLLAGDSSIEVKKRAISILGQEDSSPARELLTHVARGQLAPLLQTDAIRQLGISGGSESRRTLADIYGASTDIFVKKYILRSFMTAGDTEHLLTVAKTEKDPDLRGEAVRQLGAMGASSALQEVYKTESSDEVKAQILRGLSTSGSAGAVKQIAQNDPSPAMRQTAIRDLGIMGRDSSGETLVALYGTEKDTAVRKEILRALFVQGNVKALVDLARKEADPDLKVFAVRQLSTMKSKEATDYLVELLNK